MSTHRHEESWIFHLDQMVQAINKIERYVRGMTQVDFLQDERTIDAVIRNLEIIGEACHHIPQKIHQHYANVPWVSLRHMRNFLSHEYFAVDPHIVWETVARDLQGLKMSLKRIARENP